MATNTSPIGMDFFFDYDNETFPLFNLESNAVHAAENPVFGVAGDFYSQSPRDFETSANDAKASLLVI